MEDFEELKKRYSDELMRFSPGSEANIDSAAEAQEIRNAQRAQNSNTIANVPANAETGFMQIRATALQQSVPISGAKIVISKPVGEESSVMWSDTTDESGKSSIVELPAPAKVLSESPSNGGAVPYAVYNVRIEAQGFYTVYSINAQVFPGQLSVVAVDMIPKKETELFTEEDMTFETPPSQLLNT